MGKIKYKFIKNENSLRNEINNLDKLARAYLIKIEELYIEDLFFMSVIDKSIKLLDSFLFAFDRRNITVLATLTRVQMDCATRAFATTIVNDSSEFCKSIILDNKQVNKQLDKNNKLLTDKHLCEELGNYLNLPIYELYKKVCGFVHFSSSSFHNITKTHKKYDISMYISRNNIEENEKEFKRLSLELANQFYFFGLILIEDIFASWLNQKSSYKI